MSRRFACWIRKESGTAKVALKCAPKVRDKTFGAYFTFFNRREVVLLRGGGVGCCSICYGVTHPLPPLERGREYFRVISFGKGGRRKFRKKIQPVFHREEFRREGRAEQDREKNSLP